MPGYAYIVYTDMIYKVATGGKCASQLRKEKNLKKDANIRKFMSPEELIKVAEVEAKVVHMLDAGLTYYYIRGFLDGNMEQAMIDMRKSEERKQLEAERWLMIEEKSNVTAVDDIDVPF